MSSCCAGVLHVRAFTLGVTPTHLSATPFCPHRTRPLACRSLSGKGGIVCGMCYVKYDSTARSLLSNTVKSPVEFRQIPSTSPVSISRQIPTSTHRASGPLHRQSRIVNASICRKFQAEAHTHGPLVNTPSSRCARLAPLVNARRRHPNACAASGAPQRLDWAGYLGPCDNRHGLTSIHPIGYARRWCTAAPRSLRPPPPPCCGCGRTLRTAFLVSHRTVLSLFSALDLHVVPCPRRLLATASRWRPAPLHAGCLRGV